MSGGSLIVGHTSSSRPAANPHPPVAIIVDDIPHQPFKSRGSVSITVPLDDGDDGGKGEGEGTSRRVDLPAEPVFMTRRREEWSREKYYDEPNPRETVGERKP